MSDPFREHGIGTAGLGGSGRRDPQDINMQEYKNMSRIILKLSGEAAGPKGGFDLDTVRGRGPGAPGG